MKRGIYGFSGIVFALTLFLGDAHGGDTQELRELGYRHAFGNGVEADFRAAFQYFLRARDEDLRAGDNEAVREDDYCLAYLADVGSRSVNVRDPAPLRLYREAQASGSPELLRQLPGGAKVMPRKQPQWLGIDDFPQSFRRE